MTLTYALKIQEKVFTAEDFIPSKKRQSLRTPSVAALQFCLHPGDRAGSVKNPLINEPKSVDEDSTGV